MSFALIIVFGLLVLVLNSFAMPFVILSTIPLGLIGFSTAFYLHGRPLSFLAFIGIIGLVGVVVDTGVILVSYIKMLKKENNGMSWYLSFKEPQECCKRSVEKPNENVEEKKEENL